MGVVTRHCRFCQASTKHTKLRFNVFGETNEGIISRILWGIFSFGANDAMADRRLECNECGAVRKP